MDDCGSRIDNNAPVNKKILIWNDWAHPARAPCLKPAVSRICNRQRAATPMIIEPAFRARLLPGALASRRRAA
jgi:hypothetical protein